MSRNEHDNIDHLKIPDNTPLEESYNTIGDYTMVGELTCAKQITYPNRKNKQYYVLYGGNQLYNPEMAKSDVRYHKRLQWKLKLVSEHIFTQYLLFLRTKKTLFLRNAEREI